MALSPVERPEQVKVLPWFAKEGGMPSYVLSFSEIVELDLGDPDKGYIDTVQGLVSEIDEKDPWIAQEYGITGPGTCP